MIATKEYIKLLKSDNTVDFVEGTTAAGKTTTIVPTKFIYAVMKSSKTKHLIAGDSLGVIASNILYAGGLGLCDLYPDIQVYLNGGANQKLPHIKLGKNIIYLVGYDNISRFKKVLGGQFGAVYIDEFNIAQTSFLNELFLPRFEYLIATLNPDNPNLEIYANFINRARPMSNHKIPDYMWEYLKTATPHDKWGYWFMTYNDNPSITKERINELLTSLLPGTVQYKTKILGQRAGTGDLIFGQVPPKNIICEDDLKEHYAYKFTAALDTAYSRMSDDTMAYGFGMIDDMGIYIKLDELVFNNKDTNTKVECNGQYWNIPVAPSDICLIAHEFLTMNTHKYGMVRDFVIDSPATVVEYEKLRKANGWLQRAANANKFKNKVKVEDRCIFVNSWLATGKYLIMQHCKHHISEVSNYAMKNGKPEDANNHTIDETSYEWIPYRDKVGK